MIQGSAAEAKLNSAGGYGIELMDAPKNLVRIKSIVLARHVHACHWHGRAYLESHLLGMFFYNFLMVCARVMIVTFLLLSWLTAPSCSWGSRKENSYVKDACSVTTHQDLCIASLSSYSNTAKRDPSKWARAGVSVTIGVTKNTTRYLIGLMKKNSMRGRNRVAVLDCVEEFQDALDNLHKSLGVLRHISSELFDTQMEDITTWIGSALTDEDTCLDGFEGQKGKEIKKLATKVTKVSYFTSNALALVTKLASAGP
ncbi:hypothetical protein L1987_21803 [Smallanthus sonchifolius]|uniref:Uncharacterized protein n=1 Tax=Smallanthus sonchifolius TaxID=185202 RepID=A0ACB9IEJ8_9ASTR|nr:hypothetical protein L1987_21803 [Smallanthus sonchifolius]